MVSRWREMGCRRFEELWNLQLLFKDDIPILVCTPIILTCILAENLSMLHQRILQQKSTASLTFPGAKHGIKSRESTKILNQLQGRRLGCSHIA